MSDLIERQAAIDAVYEAFCYAYCDNCEKNLDDDLCGDCHRKYQNWSASKETIEKVINALPSAQPEQQWIPCSERLPENDDYRPCYGYDDGAVWWINDIGQMGLGWYYTSTKTWAYYNEISASEKHVGNVVAWMPLPEPYKERREE